MAAVAQVRTYLEEPMVVVVDLVAPMDQLHQEYRLEAVEEEVAVAVVLLETMDNQVVQEDLVTQDKMVLVEDQALLDSLVALEILEEHQLLEELQQSVFITPALHHQIHIPS